MLRIFSLFVVFLLVVAPQMSGAIGPKKNYEVRTDFSNPLVVLVWTLYVLWFIYPVIRKIREGIRYRNIR